MTFLLYKRVTEQYENPEILKIIRSLIPQDIVLQTTEEDSNIVPLLTWFKNEFMKWTPKDPVCEMCINRSDSTSAGSDSSSSSSRRSVPAATPIMQVKKIIVGNSWKTRKVEILTYTY
jgi:hypothetical protein